MPWRRWINWGAGALVVLILFAILLPFVEHLREDARRSTSKNNLKSLGLALQNYHVTFETLPPGASMREDGTPLLGWQVPLLPYLSATPYYE